MSRSIQLALVFAVAATLVAPAVATAMNEAPTKTVAAPTDATPPPGDLTSANRFGALMDRVRGLPLRPRMIGPRPAHRLDHDPVPGVVFKIRF